MFTKFKGGETLEEGDCSRPQRTEARQVPRDNLPRLQFMRVQVRGRHFTLPLPKGDFEFGDQGFPCPLRGSQGVELFESRGSAPRILQN